MNYWKRLFWMLAASALFTSVSAAQTLERPPAFREAQLGAVAQLNIGTEPVPGRGCSAVLITPIHALTAAHCVNPGQTHTLTFTPNRAPVAVTATATPHPDYIYDVPLPGTARFENDIALLTLTTQAPTDPLPLGAPDETAPHALFGFSNPDDRRLMGAEACQIGIAAAPIIPTTCPAIGGLSGGALVRDTPQGPALVAIAVARIDDPNGQVQSIALAPDLSTFPALASALE